MVPTTASRVVVAVVVVVVVVATSVNSEAWALCRYMPYVASLMAAPLLGRHCSPVAHRARRFATGFG